MGKGLKKSMRTLSLILFFCGLVAMAPPTNEAQAVSPPRAVLRFGFVASPQTGNETPARHSLWYQDDGIQWDIYGTPGGAVRPAFYSSDGDVTLSVSNGGAIPGAGNIVNVEVFVNGTSVGTVRFMHLEAVKLTAAGPTDPIGNLVPPTFFPGPPASYGYPWQGGVWEVSTVAGIHTHIDADHACYRPLPPNHNALDPSEPILMLSAGFEEGNVKPCNITEMRYVNDESAPPPPAADGRFRCRTQKQIPAVECDALVALYNSTGGDTWTTSTGWLATRTPCEWYGVTCDTGHVTRLVLLSNAVSGSLPSELGDLTELEWLWFDDNPSLSGPIPDSIGDLTNLEILTISRSAVTGAIPSQLGLLTHLEQLGLAANSLTGQIPASLGSLTSLWWLNIENNMLTGSIPPQLGNLPNLEGLSLSMNSLTGSIPSQLGNLTNLEILSLYDNSLSDAIPFEIGNLTNLHTLWLSQNSLHGPVPTSLLNLGRLTQLALSGQSGCLTSTDPDLTEFLEGFDPNWNDGCP